MRALAGNGPCLFSCDAGETFARGLRRPHDDIVKPRMAELLEVDPSVYENGGAKHVTIHDLRRTFRRHQMRIGTPPHISEQLVGHRPRSIVRIYDPSDPWAWFTEKLEAIERWGGEIERLASELKAQQ